MLNFILSILPGVLIIIYIYQKDKHEKEPYKYIFICVLFGMLSCIPAIFGTLGFEGILGLQDAEKSGNILIVAVYAFVAVALSEEFAKFIFLRFYMYPKKEFDEPMDGIVYSVVIGMGFAILENILYVAGGGFQVAVLRMFTAVPGHAAFGVIMGYYVGLAKFDKENSTRLIAQGVLSAAAVHGAYDFFLFQNNFAGLALLAFVVLFMGIRMSKQLIALHVENSPHKSGASVEINDDDKPDDFSNHLIE